MKLCLFVYVNIMCVLRKSAYCLSAGRDEYEQDAHFFWGGGESAPPLCLHTGQQHPRGLWMYTQKKKKTHAQSVFV